MTVLQGDCFELLAQVPNGAVDMILTDPPYGIANDTKITRSGGRQKFGKAKAISHDFGAWDRFDGFDDFMTFTKRWVDLCVPKLRGGGYACLFL
ncbi:MAG: site-specific DNA-methyltransferase [Alphaproteobacteria bacterium]|nr:site-specific DNA-methyltransferase [Alphaproteobacteria bacterium]